MTLLELFEQCKTAIEEADKSGYTPGVILKIPEGNSGSKRRKMVLAPGGKGPMGKIILWGFDGYDTVVFNPREIIVYLINLVGMENEVMK